MYVDIQLNFNDMLKYIMIICWYVVCGNKWKVCPKIDDFITVHTLWSSVMIGIIEALAQAFLHQIKICPLSAKMARLKIRKARKKRGKAKYSVMGKRYQNRHWAPDNKKCRSNKAPLHETRHQGTGWVQTLNFLSALCLLTYRIVSSSILFTKYVFWISADIPNT